MCRATSCTETFAGTTWVVKRYLPAALEIISDAHLKTEMHTKKVVQMHMLAKNFADQLAQQVKKNGLVDFGQPLQYGKVSFQPKVFQKKRFKTLKEAIVINHSEITVPNQVS